MNGSFLRRNIWEAGDLRLNISLISRLCLVVDDNEIKYRPMIPFFKSSQFLWTFLQVQNQTHYMQRPVPFPPFHCVILKNTGASEQTWGLILGCAHPYFSSALCGARQKTHRNVSLRSASLFASDGWISFFTQRGWSEHLTATHSATRDGSARLGARTLAHA